MNLDLFSAEDTALPTLFEIAPGAWALPGFAVMQADALWTGIQKVIQTHPLRHLVTPGGSRMSVAMSNCGDLGWVSDAAGYRYQSTDPLTQTPWPAMPQGFREMAMLAAELAGYPAFEPDACLINRYAPGARMTLHQDKNERDYSAPIVSVSLGLHAVFELGGVERGDKVQRLRLQHGDVLVWGGPARLRFHGVRAVDPGLHLLTGAYRFNLTFRKAA
ncbi:MAG: DNA oxidative demethylase AlkB [Betaproteobacteria bacterium]|nr:DNA oxidative demethylase AlkB [Betaproteobacteria bacterium]